MKATAFRVEMQFRAATLVREGNGLHAEDCGESGACDWVSGLLTEQGMWPLAGKPPLLDWTYDQCGGESVGPQATDEGKYAATLWLLPQPGTSSDGLLNFLSRGNGLYRCCIVEQKEIEVPDNYHEEDFLSEIFPLPIHTAEWVDRHSVNCIKCHELVDERECIPGPGGEGDICIKCQALRPVKESYENGECPDCGEPIPDDAEEGECCSNCDHTFWR